ncbi:MAG: hypothetical protein K8F25_10365 [Fimbriimonadaceae bacterium]|nr:hypothetical protein [Alphaproteobacteria bacterium]
MTNSTERNEFIASSASALLGDIEKIKSLSVRRLDTDEVLSTKGRESWALAQLIVTGPKGFTTLERPAPRTAHYVHLLRKHGLPVQTIEEAHGGTYRGTHARYRLDVPLAILDAEFAL